jgi:hypothetical protein
MKEKDKDFHIGQLVQVKENIEPESEFWEKGYWVIPKGHFAIVKDVDKENWLCLIEYLDATFYVDKNLLIEAPLKA